MSEQFDEALVERLASTALRTWYNANQPIAPSAWARIVQAILTELSKTHAIVPKAEWQALDSLFWIVNHFLSEESVAQAMTAVNAADFDALCDTASEYLKAQIEKKRPGIFNEEVVKDV